MTKRLITIFLLTCSISAFSSQRSSLLIKQIYSLPSPVVLKSCFMGKNDYRDLAKEIKQVNKKDRCHYIRTKLEFSFDANISCVSIIKTFRPKQHSGRSCI